MSKRSISKKTPSIFTLSTRLRELNETMDLVAELGGDTLREIDSIDFTSITDLARKENLERLFDETGHHYRELHRRSEIMIDLLLQKKEQLPKAKSLSISRNRSPIARRTRRIRSI